MILLKVSPAEKDEIQEKELFLDIDKTTEFKNNDVKRTGVMISFYSISRENDLIFDLFGKLQKRCSF